MYYRYSPCIDCPNGDCADIFCHFYLMEQENVRLREALEKCRMYATPLLGCNPPESGAGANIISVVSEALKKC